MSSKDEVRAFFHSPPLHPTPNRTAMAQVEETSSLRLTDHPYQPQTPAPTKPKPKGAKITDLDADEAGDKLAALSVSEVRRVLLRLTLPSWSFISPTHTIQNTPDAKQGRRRGARARQEGGGRGSQGQGRGGGSAAAGRKEAVVARNPFLAHGRSGIRAGGASCRRLVQATAAAPAAQPPPPAAQPPPAATAVWGPGWGRLCAPAGGGQLPRGPRRVRRGLRVPAAARVRLSLVYGVCVNQRTNSYLTSSLLFSYIKWLWAAAVRGWRRRGRVRWGRRRRRVVQPTTATAAAATAARVRRQRAAGIGGGHD